MSSTNEESAPPAGVARKVAATRPDQMPAELLEFIQAIDDYKRINSRPFPSWGEVLEILCALGYRKDERY